MSLYSKDNSLKPPATPKLDDENADRGRREQDAKIVELQTLMRAAIEAIVKLGGTV